MGGKNTHRCIIKYAKKGQPVPRRRIFRSSHTHNGVPLRFSARGKLEMFQKSFTFSFFFSTGSTFFGPPALESNFSRGGCSTVSAPKKKWVAECGQIEIQDVFVGFCDNRLLVFNCFFFSLCCIQIEGHPVEKWPVRLFRAKLMASWIIFFFPRFLFFFDCPSEKGTRIVFLGTSGHLTGQLQFPNVSTSNEWMKRRISFFLKKKMNKKWE